MLPIWWVIQTIRSLVKCSKKEKGCHQQNIEKKNNDSIKIGFYVIRKEESFKMEKMLIGIDIGGTTIKMGLINQTGEIIHKWEIPTNKKEKGIHIAENVWQSIEKTLAEQHPEMEFSGVGVGAPGFVNRQTGIVEEAVNIGWKNYDLRDRIKKLSGLPVVIENDANLAALAENWKHRGKHSENVIFITLGTGVGGGIIVNGDIMDGANHTAAEIGHVLVD